MLHFIIMDGLPYSYDVNTGKAYKCRFDNDGFTAGEEVEVSAPPAVIFSELSIKAQCANDLDSIKQAKTTKTRKTVKKSE